MPRKRKSLSNESVSPGRVLALLPEGEAWRSGEEMAALLGVSRAAVAKHIATLRREGHVIESVTRRGYRLAVRHEALSREAVERTLRTRRFGRGEWLVLQETGSTNSVAIARALADAEEGAVVLAERQTRGKGRKGREWVSCPRGLQVSLVLRPGERESGAVAVMALEAMRDAVEEAAGVRPELKMPNDLLLDGRKIAGVLVESGERAGEPDWMAVGVGLNVNSLAEDFPPGLRDTATSVLAASGRTVSRNRLLAAFLNHFEKAFQPPRRRSAR